MICPKLMYYGAKVLIVVSGCSVEASNIQTLDAFNDMAYSEDPYNIRVPQQ